MDKESLKYQIALTLVPGIGSILAKNLISYCGSVEAIFNTKKGHLLKIPGIGYKIAEAILKRDLFDRAEEEIKFIEKHNIKPLFYLEEDYPYRLKECTDSPVLLYFKGDADLNVSKIISVVGTRKATDYGKALCEKIIEGLAKHEVLIVSGLAYGIDVAAHRAALKNSLKTVGVLGHGLDTIYPFQHKNIAEKICMQGGLLAEFPSGTQPDKENFPKRNRIVAGLADAVLVVESAVKGGAMITAGIANSYNRDVLAIPGKVKDMYSQGTNFLIKSHRAALVESAKDIEYVLGWEDKLDTAPKQKKLMLDLNKEEAVVLEILRSSHEIHVDALRAQSNLGVSEVAAALLNLEFLGAVTSLPGKKYKLN